MSTPQPAAGIPRNVLETAARWFVQVQTETGTAQSFIGWQQWLAACPDHRRAYEQIEDAALGARALPPTALRLPTDVDMTKDAYDGSQSIADWRRAQTTRALGARAGRARRWPVRAGFSIAACTAAALVIGIWHLAREDATPDVRNEMYRTTHGQRQTIDLPDGSTVTLDADSTLQVQYGERIRQLQLQRGEAYIQVAKDAQRRFAVNAGSTQIVALGTAFNIRLSENRIVVAVTDGKVKVTVAAMHTTSSMQLVAEVSAGEAVFYSDSGRLQAMPSTEAALATSWLHGRRQYRNEPLRYVLADIDRYIGRRIEVADEAAGELKFTGSLNLHNSAAWLRGLNVALPVRITELEDGGLSVSLNSSR